MEDAQPQAAEPPWSQGGNGGEPGHGKPPSAPPAPVLDDKQMESWVLVASDQFELLAGVLTGSQRDKILYRRRLRAAGMEDPKSAKQQRILQATQRAERAEHAALEAAAEVVEFQELLRQARADLEQARVAAAARVGGGAQAAAPVAVGEEFWEEIGKLTTLVKQLVVHTDEGQAAAGDIPGGGGSEVGRVQGMLVALMLLLLPLQAPLPSQYRTRETKQ
ncbi:unnamed protein product, partial [Prorocentrum cordatum]